MSGTDATVLVAGPLLDIVDDDWRADTLPEDGERTATPRRRPTACRPAWEGKKHRTYYVRFPLPSVHTRLALFLFV